MRVGVLGTGMVGQTLAAALAGVGNDVAIGTRDPEAAEARTEAPRPGMPSFAQWHAANPEVAVVTFADAAAHGEILINATAGAGSLDALRAAGEANLEGKILIDLSNPLDSSRGMPPTLFVANTDSLGERIQRAFPGAKVVKTLNTVTASVMVDPNGVGGGDHHVFVSGDDDAAKAEVTQLLQEWFGWRHVIHLGDITTARGAEMYVALWIRVMAATGSPTFNIRIVR
jgi:predicted dinucleotide-binding enzyme